MKTVTIENLRAHHTPPSPTPPPTFQVEPPHESKVKRAATNGGCLETARHQLISDTAAKLADVARIAPGWAAKHTAAAAKIESLSAEYFTAVLADNHILCDYQAAVRGRAITVHGIRDKEKLLEDAKTLLESPDSLKLSGEDLMVLTQRVKHLPAVIKTDWSEIPSHESRIKELESRTGISVERIISDLREQLTGPDGRCQDLDLRRAAEFLPLETLVTTVS